MKKLLIGLLFASTFGYGQIGQKTTLIAGSGVTLNQAGNTYTVNATGSGGTVTSVNAGTNLSITAGAASVNPTLSFSGTLPIANGGTNSTLAATSNKILIGNGTAWTPTTMSYPGTITSGYVPYATGTNVLGSGSGLKFVGTQLNVADIGGVATNAPFIDLGNGVLYNNGNTKGGLSTLNWDTQTLITDGNNTSGAWQYGANYGAQFGIRSLTDKGYVDSVKTAAITGAITPTTVNKVKIVAPATSATVTVADGKAVTVNNTLTLAGTDGQTMTFTNGSGTIATTTATATLTNKTLTTPTIGDFSNATHSHTNASGGGQLVATTALSDVVVGTYTPTVSAVTNCSSATADVACRYTRVGSQCTVSFEFYVTQTTTLLSSKATISLPITVSSNFSTFDQALGCANLINNATADTWSAVMTADITGTKTVAINWKGATGTGQIQRIYGTFTYTIY